MDLDGRYGPWVWVELVRLHSGSLVWAMVLWLCQGPMVRHRVLAHQGQQGRVLVLQQDLARAWVPGVEVPYSYQPAKQGDTAALIPLSYLR